ncbi:hypothetical protein HA402_004360 [Bradysia odoriphaga]|nr:hypothetical protein HA402_004360 [Bradysia odoriphaga]
MPSQTCFEAAFDSRSHYSDSAANNNFYHVGSLRNQHRGDDQLVKSHSNYGSLRGSLLKSNQSLCSCNAETEKNSKDNLRGSSYSIRTLDYSSKYDNDGMEIDTYIDADIPPPPTPPNCKPSLSRQSSTKQTQSKSTILKNCANICIHEANPIHQKNNTINSTATTTSTADNVISNNHKNKLSSAKMTVENKNKFDQNDGYNCMNNKPITADKDEESLFFYHHEPNQYMPNYDTLHHIPGKYNTIGPIKSYRNDTGKYDSNNKFHSSTCNLKPFHKSTNNLMMNGRYFTNSLTNFHYPPFNYHHYGNGHSPYIQFQNIDGDMDLPPLMGIGCDHHVSVKQQGHIPWKHRQCPSIASSSSVSTITKWDPFRHWLAVTSILLIAGAAGVAVPLALRVAAGAPFEERLQAATQLLNTVPLIDGHNDLPWNIRKFLHNQLNEFNFDINLKDIPPWSRSVWSHTDLSRLKKGRVSAQFWAAYVPCEAQHKDAVQLTLEQIDVIIRLTEKYSPQLTTCTSALDIVEAHKNHQLCSLTGVEGGHSLGGSLSVLRTFYSLGVRYMTLTSTCHTPWADSSYADSPKFDVKHGGLTEFGKTIIREMNRLGMIVDLSHVSVGTMKDALAISEAPVIFSHSSAYELCNSSRNVQDSILELIVKNRGLVMVNFYSRFLSCSENATVQDAVAHLNHIKLVAGVDYVGLGAGYDGINFTPKGLEDVSSYPVLFAELLGDGWTADELTKLAGQNFLRVLAEVESIRDKKRDEGIRPYEDILNFRLEDPYNCTTS